jgi:Arylsulfotransferase (ASST)
MKIDWSLIGFLVSLGVLVFIYGVAVGLFKIFPYQVLENSVAAAEEWVRYPRHKLRLEPQKFLARERLDGTGVVTHLEAEPDSGQTFIEGFFGDSNGMKLIDMDGKTIHEWRVSFNEIWPEAPQLDTERHDWDIEVHGALLYPNGDVVFNFQYGGLVRIDSCSRVLWRLPHQTHHSIFEDSDGNLWLPARRLREQSVAEFPQVPAPFQEELILKASPDGKILREISVLDVIFESQYEGVLFASGDHEAEIKMPLDGDFTHLNDVEVLPPEMASAFPMFEAGDLLVSLRNLNFLMVLSPESERIKWSMIGPFVRQHDPDFLPDGSISVFDNRRDGAQGKIFGGSRILELDPITREVTTVYGAKDDQWFYTDTQGDHQRLPNGNILITESEVGHVFEITADGEVVWSFINRVDDDLVAAIGRATRFPADYMVLEDPVDCDDR